MRTSTIKLVKSILYLCFLIPNSIIAQIVNSPNTDSIQGIKFINSSDWQKLVNDARNQGKFIFVDCYTTWCKPCKEMEKKVFNKKNVGDYVNERFISLRLQLDSTNKDQPEIKDSYGLASSFKKEFKIDVYPTFLFFSPNGKVIHRALGFKNDRDFLQTIKDALNPERQFYSLLDEFKGNKSIYLSLPYLTKTAFTLKENKIATQAGNKYVKDYLLKLPKNEILSKDNIEFMAFVIKISKNPYSDAFTFFFKNQSVIDGVMGQKNYAQKTCDFAITSAFIEPSLSLLKKDQTPSWNKIFRRIKREFDNKVAERTTLTSKIIWYRDKENWDQYIKYSTQEIEKYGIDTSTWLGDALVNNMVFEGIFLHSNDPKYLVKAIEWMKDIIRRNPKYATYYDTYANLLHKLGQTNMAIEFEERALALDPDDKDIRANLQKMRLGSPTWILK